MITLKVAHFSYSIIHKSFRNLSKAFDINRLPTNKTEINGRRFKYVCQSCFTGKDKFLPWEKFIPRKDGVGVFTYLLGSGRKQFRFVSLVNYSFLISIYTNDIFIYSPLFFVKKIFLIFLFRILNCTFTICLDMFLDSDIQKTIYQ